MLCEGVKIKEKEEEIQEDNMYIREVSVLLMTLTKAMQSVENGLFVCLRGKKCLVKSVKKRLQCCVGEVRQSVFRTR